MSNFKYIEKDGKVYMVIGEGRMKVLWKKRWVPASEIIETEPVIEDETLDVSSIDEIDEDTNSLELNSGDIDEDSHTIVLD